MASHFLPNSDLLVWVEHDSEGAAHGSWGQVLGELGTHDAALAMGGSDLAPDALVADASLGVLALVDEGDALSVVPGAGGAVLAVLDGDECSVLSLSSLASLEAEEDATGVESAQTRDKHDLRSGARNIDKDDELEVARCSDDLPDGLSGGLRF